MRKIIIAAAVLATLSSLLLRAAPALALNGKSWVSNTGSDTADCHDPANACRTFSRAFAQTNPGGEIGVINAGDYGQLTITHAISITNDSAGEAGLLNTDGTCPGSQLMDIRASAGDIISLRGLVFEGCTSGGGGVLFNGGTALHIQNCVFRNFEAPGGTAFLFIAGNKSRLFISDSIFINNGSGGDDAGITIVAKGGGVDVAMERVELEDNIVGLRLDAHAAIGGNGIHAVLRDGVVSGNASDGISVFTQSGGQPAFLFVERSATFGNAGSGIVANGPGATVLLSDTKIVRNGTGVSAINGGQPISYGNNDNNNNIGAEGTATSSLSLF